MRKVVVVVLAIALGAAGGAWFRGIEVDALQHRIAELERASVEKDRARPLLAPLAQLGSLLSAHPAHAPAAQVNSVHTTHDDDDRADDDELKDDNPDGGFDPGFLTAALAAYSRRSLDALHQDVRISSAQNEILQRSADEMNRRLSAALDQLLTLNHSGTTKQYLDLAVEGLLALKDADDKFRAALDPDQVAAVDRDGFDLTSAIDPALLLRLLGASSASH